MNSPRLGLALYSTLLVLLITLASLGAIGVFRASGPDGDVEEAAQGHTYDFVSWEITHFPRKWFYRLSHLVRNRSAADEEETLTHYFSLSAQIGQLEDQPQGGDQLPALERERAGLRAEVEDILEGRMTAVLKEQGLTMNPPLFSDLGTVLPPVDFHLDTPPRVLAISPRNRLALTRSFVLEPGLLPDDFSGIEQKAESGNGGAGGQGVSALVVGIGGIATYPSLIPADDSYEQVMEGAFHEWLHQYLIVFPLGSHYFASDDARTLNESVAHMGGFELAKVYFQRYPHPALAAPPQQSFPQPGFDFTAAMRALRTQVEAMLAQGQVTEAETLMAQKRDEFAGQGYYIRRLNQAYFAFNGFYADTPGSIDPIGPKLQKLFAQAGSPGRFIRLAQGMTTREDLDRLLAAPGS